MKKIAYIELDTHAEIAQNFMELMQDSKIFSVDYYFSEKIANRIGEKSSNVYVTEHSAILNQLKNKNYDLVIIGTVHRYFDIFEKISTDFNTSIIVHNLNFLQISQTQLFLNIFKKDFTYRLKLLLKEGLLSAPKVFKNAKNLLVLDKNLAQNKFKFISVFFNQSYKEKHSEIFSIVIPGAVSQQRRDYEKIFRKISEIERNIKNGFDYSEKVIEFVFLGKAKGDELKKIINLEQSLYIISIQYFREKVPQNIFDELMQKANLLWCPIQKETEFFSNTEIYGKTKMSGNIGDAIKYGKYAIFPAEYSGSYPFIINENNNIEAQLLQINGNKNDDFEEFNKKKIRQDIEQRLFLLI